MTALPPPPALAGLDRRLAQLRARRPGGVPKLCAKVRTVVLIASSSRGGSSMFSELLRSSQNLLHFRAEVNPFLHLAGLGWPASGQRSDALDGDAQGDRVVLDRELALDLGRRRTQGWDPAQLAGSLAFRLSVQWPDLPIDPDQVAACLDEVSALTPPDGDQAAFHLAFIGALRRRGLPVDPWFYDLNPAAVRACFPDLPEPTGPPGARVIEEPPFVNVGPWRLATDGDLAQHPVVIKTPSNAYRLPFFRALFPNARLRILHLRRNPAASINGLLDGWRFRGFHAHNMPNLLQMPGYVDRRPGDRNWWKYDLPPGWEDWVGRPLAEVCGFQWRSAHAHILDFVDTQLDPADVFDLRFEDVVGPPEIRQARMGALARWLDISWDPAMARTIATGLPPVMATSRPRARRWYDRSPLLEPVLADPAVADMALRLGYTDRSRWI